MNNMIGIDVFVLISSTTTSLNRFDRISSKRIIRLENYFRMPDEFPWNAECAIRVLCEMEGNG